MNPIRENYRDDVADLTSAIEFLSKAIRALSAGHEPRSIEALEPVAWAQSNIRDYSKRNKLGAFRTEV